MTIATKIMGLLAGASAVAVFGVAIAQSVPPNAAITNPPIAAGQQSSQHTSMGETGVPAIEREVRMAVIVQEPMPVAVIQPAPVVAQVMPEPAPPTVVMGAAPAPEPAPVMVARADRN